MKNRILFVWILFFSICKLSFSQKVSFDKSVVLFDLDEKHDMMSQPMIPYLNAEMKVEFIGRSGSKNVKAVTDSLGIYTKTEIFKNVSLGRYVLESVDLDNDGDLDIVTEQSVFEVEGNEVKELANDIFLFTFKTVGDFNNDGLLDIIGEEYKTFENDKLFFLKNLGDFKFEWSLIEGGTEKYETIEVGDIDGDGDLDFGVTVSGTSKEIPINFYINDGTGIFTSVTPKYNSDDSFPGIRLYNLQFSDFDGDGDLDLITLKPSSFFEEEGIFIYENTDTFSTLDEVSTEFVWGEWNPAFYKTSLVVKSEDLNNDGHKDLIILTQAQDSFGIVVSAGIGDFKFDWPVTLGRFENEYLFGQHDGTFMKKNLSIMDFNNDGYLDISFTSGEEKKQVLILNTSSDIISSTTNLLTPGSYYLYPTIAQNQLEFEGINSQVDVSVYSVDGALQNIYTLDPNNKSIEVSALHPGLYFVSIRNRNGENVVLKFIKN